MNQRGEFLGLRLAGQQGDFSAVADAEGGGDAFVEFKRDVLRVQEVNQPVAVCADFAADACARTLEGLRLRSALTSNT